MTDSAIVAATVGGAFGLRTTFGVQTAAAVSLGVSGQAITNADDSHTANIIVEILTPGVSFFADSGALCALPAADPTPVPEPSTILLTLSGAALAAKRRRTKRSVTTRGL